MRPTWKGSISFGLVNIPVAVYPATREEKVSFKQLRKRDLSPIRYKKVAETDNTEVPSTEIVKAYEYEKHKWVTLTEEDFAKVEIESTHTIEITDFVDLTDINPKYFYKPYFLEAQKGGERGYALMHRALRETGKAGIAKVAIHNREYLSCVKPDGLFLILDLMHFAQEVLQPEGLREVTGAEVGPKEIEMAKMLVDSMTGPWTPEAYEDRYQHAVREMIEAKVKHLPSPKAPRPSLPEGTMDIVAILQRSLEKSAASGKRGGSVKAPARTTHALVSKKRRAKVS